MGPSLTILLYGRQSLGEGLSLGEVRNTTFMLSGVISWVGKQAQLNTNPLSLQEGQWLIAQAITEQHIKARGPGHPCSHPLATLPFRFCSRDESLQEERFHSAEKHMEEPGHTCWPSHHDWGQALQHSWHHGQWQ